MSRFDTLHFRQFILDVFRKLELHDFIKLKEIVETSRLLPEQLPYDSHGDEDEIRHKCITFLKDRGYVKADDVEILYLLFTYIRRVELLKDIRSYEAKYLRKYKHNLHALKHPWMLTMREVITYVIVLMMVYWFVILFENSVGIQRTFTFVIESVWLKVIVLAILLGAWVFNEQLLDMSKLVRSWLCTLDCEVGSHLYFEYERGNRQKIIVENNKEFPFKSLKQKFPHLRKHPDKRMIYFLNTNLYVNGGIATNGSYIDNQREIRGAEAFAMDPDATSVWYFHGQHEGWMEYETAANIRWFKTKENTATTKIQFDFSKKFKFLLS